MTTVMNKSVNYGGEAVNNLLCFVTYRDLIFCISLSIKPVFLFVPKVKNVLSLHFQGNLKICRLMSFPHIDRVNRSRFDVNITPTHIIVACVKLMLIFDFASVSNEQN